MSEHKILKILAEGKGYSILPSDVLVREVGPTGAVFEYRIAEVPKAERDSRSPQLKYWVEMRRAPNGSWESAYLGKKAHVESCVDVLVDHIVASSNEFEWLDPDLKARVDVLLGAKAVKVKEEEDKREQERIEREADIKRRHALEEGLRKIRFKKAPFQIRNSDGELVDAEDPMVLPGSYLGINRHENGWCVTHIPTGMAVINVGDAFRLTQREAKMAVFQLWKKYGAQWSFTSPGGERNLKNIVAVVMRLKQDVLADVESL